MTRPLQRLTPERITALLSWYEKNKRDFPWRANPDPYWVWIAEVMSQQTQMSALVPYFYRFIERFPSIAALAAAPLDDVLAAWTGLGYYSRARNVHAAARTIAGQLAGKAPTTADGWQALPGIGPYTAAAIASQCFKAAEPVWDGNVLRVCSRLEARDDVHGKGFQNQMLGALAVKIANYDPSSFNQAFMELGAVVCTPKAPACGRCPVQGCCRAFQRGEQGLYPPPKPRKTGVDVSCNVWVVLRQNKAWLECRPRELWFGGMWDFPSELGGATNPRLRRSAPADAVESRPIQKEIRHQVTHHRIRLKGKVLVVDGKRSLPSFGNGRWVLVKELLGDAPPLPLSTTARKVLRQLAQEYGELLA